MSCIRAERIDVEAFLVEPMDARFDDFRSHYPTCDECAEVVADWTAFGLGLRDVLAAQEGVVAAAEDHPAIEALERFIGAPSLAPEVEAHLGGCATCRIEVDAMRGFVAPEFAAVPTPSRTPVADEAPGWLTRLLAALGLEGVSPMALATTAAAILVALGTWWSVGPDTSEPVAPQLVERHAEPRLETPESVEPRPTSIDEAPTPATERLAAVDPAVAPSSDSDARAQEDAAPSELALSEEGDAMLAEADAAVAPAPVAEPPARAEPPALAEPGDAEEGEAVVVLLAALDVQGVADYRRPDARGEVDWLSRIGAGRSGAEGPTIEVRAPADHTGTTLESAPRLWWSISAESEFDVRFVVTTAEAIDPLVEATIEGPWTAGNHVVDLSDYDVELAAGVPYRWSVSLVVDARRRSSNPMAAGSLLRLSSASPASASVGASAPAERGHALAREGVWYDAYDFFATLARDHPDAASPRRSRDALRSASGR